jgi:hypothetical protein
VCVTQRADPMTFFFSFCLTLAVTSRAPPAPHKHPHNITFLACQFRPIYTMKSPLLLPVILSACLVSAFQAKAPGKLVSGVRSQRQSPPQVLDDTETRMKKRKNLWNPCLLRGR